MESGTFMQIRLDHDLQVGTGINVTVGKQKFSIPVSITQGVTQKMGVNEIMKDIIKH